MGGISREPHRPKYVASFSEMYKECRQRVTLKFERRFFGITEETDFKEQGRNGDDARIKLLQREITTLLLDPRVCVDLYLLNADR